MRIRVLNKYVVHDDPETFFFEFSGTKKQLEEFIKKDKARGEFRIVRFMNMVKDEGFFIRLVS